MFTTHHFRELVLAQLVFSISLGGALSGHEKERPDELASPSDQPSTVDAEDSLPTMRARILFVKRDWSSDSDEEIRSALRNALSSQNAAEQSKLVEGVEGDDSLNVGAFLPTAGHAAIFNVDDFASLHRWLRDNDLLVEEKEISLEPTRFGGRYVASFQPVVDRGVTARTIWRLQLDLVRSEDPKHAVRVKLRRVHNRPSPPGGPLLRGASVDIRKEVSFFLPHDRIVAMTWYAHPDDVGLLPKKEQRVVEPILVLEERATAEKKATKAEAAFHFPERVVDLITE